MGQRRRPVIFNISNVPPYFSGTLALWGLDHYINSVPFQALERRPTCFAGGVLQPRKGVLHDRQGATPFIYLRPRKAESVD